MDTAATTATPAIGAIRAAAIIAAAIIATLPFSIPIIPIPHPFH